MRRMVLLLALTLISAAPAAAQPPPSVPGQGPGGPSSSFDQYSEQIPTQSGDVTPGVGGTTDIHVSPVVLAAIANRGGRDTTALSRIVSSTSYGAPAKGFRSATRQELHRPAGLAAAVRALGSGVGVVLVLLVLLAAAAVAVPAARRLSGAR